MVNNKGQESAPFELLISVIIMGFVIFVGLIAMNQLNEQKCINETKAKLEEMKTKIETVVTERSPQQITFLLNTSGFYGINYIMLWNKYMIKSIVIYIHVITIVTIYVVHSQPNKGLRDWRIEEFRNWRIKSSN